MIFAPRGKSGGVRGAQEIGLVPHGERHQANQDSKHDGSGGQVMDSSKEGPPPETRMLGFVLILILTALVAGGFIWLLSQLGH